jgi:hypothetical protein
LVSEALGTVHAKVLEIVDGGQSLLVRAGVGCFRLPTFWPCSGP